MRWICLLSVCLATLAGCLDIGGKLDTPIEGGNGGALGGGSLGNLGNGDGGDGGALGGFGDGGGSLGNVGTFSCDQKSLDSTCSVYASGTTETYAQANCTGTLLRTTCPSTSSVGSCTIFGERDVYYSVGATPHTAATAKATCAYYGGVYSAN